jgi:serine protease Do
MSTRKITLFYALLIAIASLAVGMVIASRLDLSPQSSAQTLAVPAMNSAPLSGPIDATTFRNIAKAQEPIVVNIATESRRRTQDLTEFFGGDDLFNRFFGGGQDRQTPRARPREQVVESAGSGFIISRDGFILTNNHVVEGATRIKVFLIGEDQVLDAGHEAKVIGTDPLTDSALIQLSEKPSAPLAEAKFGDSSQMQPGDWVMAIGNPFSLAHTVTVGVISADKRPFPVAEGRWQDVLQTDAAINPGNSGGPLLNIRGEVVGINTAILANGGGASSGNIGVGFAIPINVVRDLLPLLRAGKVTRGRIGVFVGPVPADAFEQFGLKERRGALVSTVEESGPAAKAGIEPGDIIVQYNGQPIKTRDDLIALVVNTKPGTTVPVTVIRNKREQTFRLTVEELDLAAEGGRGGRQGGESEDMGAGFGISLDNLTPDMARRMRVPAGTGGAIVTDVEPYSAADRGGLQRGDVILRVNQEPVTGARDARALLQKVPAGSRALLLVWRQGQQVFLTMRKE